MPLTGLMGQHIRDCTDYTTQGGGEILDAPHSFCQFEDTHYFLGGMSAAVGEWGDQQGQALLPPGELQDIFLRAPYIPLHRNSLLFSFYHQNPYT